MISVDYKPVERNSLVDVDLFDNFLYIKSDKDNIRFFVYNGNKYVAGVSWRLLKSTWYLDVEHCWVEGGVTLHDVPITAEKLWKVDFTRAGVTLHCNGVMVRSFEYSEQSPWDAPDADCARNVEDVPLTRIQFHATDTGSRMYGVGRKKDEDSES